MKCNLSVTKKHLKTVFLHSKIKLLFDFNCDKPFIQLLKRTRNKDSSEEKNQHHQK